jgi:hypothetical protein
MPPSSGAGGADGEIRGGHEVGRERARRVQAGIAARPGQAGDPLAMRVVGADHQIDAECGQSRISQGLKRAATEVVRIDVAEEYRHAAHPGLARWLSNRFAFRSSM